MHGPDAFVGGIAKMIMCPAAPEILLICVSAEIHTKMLICVLAKTHDLRLAKTHVFGQDSLWNSYARMQLFVGDFVTSSVKSERP